MFSVRIAAVRYLNTVPLIEGLDKTAGVRVQTAVPSKIAGMVATGEADIGLASIIDAASSSVGMTLIPAGMIGCDGPTLTVRLYSRTPINQVRTVHADTDSRTSVALCRVLLDMVHGLLPEFVSFDARERVADGGQEANWPDAMLLIGDKVVTDSPPAVRYPHQMDLGSAWKELTGLPFVYATWMCRSDAWDDPDSGPRLRTAAALLDRQVRHNLTRLDWIIANRSADHRWPADLARSYLTEHLRFCVGDREREAVNLFLSHAARADLCRPEPARWSDDHARTAVP
ncbi:MAG: menaquinone biosynthesis protein [Phycisphaeraceae bacterium]|nr:menaquinone biosynthesis protein [Phycisphaerae bacterium]MBX3391025.1 menaquinone biosynthesis protein [Phycisphaeraceae bacterium]